MLSSLLVLEFLPLPTSPLSPFPADRNEHHEVQNLKRALYLQDGQLLGQINEEQNPLGRE